MAGVFMKRIKQLFLGVLMLAAAVLGQTAPLGSPTQPVVHVGRIERLDDFPSRFVEARPIDVWLPGDYSPLKRYAVIYMQDGQGLFDADQTWNKQAWNVHLALSRLMLDGKVQDTFVVGIPNAAKYRYSEYYPDKYLALAPQEVRTDYLRRAQWDKPLADAYLRFLVEELKPTIDQRYATRREPAGTFVMGSSMGGMISIYALCEYPQVFGGAAGLSTHWVGRPSAWGAPQRLQNASLPLAAFNYLQGHLPRANTHRIYMDHGTSGLDAIYGIHQAVVDEIARERGYDAAHWQSRIFEGAGHTELDWAARVEIPLTFLLGKP
jgi:predicted alpha/beta superfamily hydrolase